ncbi:MAG: putative rane protein [Clostridia bacterium]|jgi:vancomycin permeability regulator SanA|nr:putative rane protein [Clostridia bacterium]
MNKGIKKILTKVLALIILIGLLVGISAAVINYLVIQTTKQKIVTINKLKEADCILVLGAYVKPNGMPSAMLKDRLSMAYEIFEADKASKFLLSGDHGTKSYDEVNSMRDYIQEKGVDKKLIFLDHAGFSTYESIYRARDIFEANKIIIVTQGYHLPRALYLAEKMGIEAQGVAAKNITYRKMELFKAREMLATVKDFVLVNTLKPKPTYLGEAIPVSGDGTLTHDK